MIYYVNNLDETIKFYHSLLKNNGALMVIIEAGKKTLNHFIWQQFLIQITAIYNRYNTVIKNWMMQSLRS